MGSTWEILLKSLVGVRDSDYLSKSGHDEARRDNLELIVQGAMIDPTEDDIGRSVIYTGNYGGPIEEGVITSFNNHAVFVRYGADKHSKGTSRVDLEWVSK